jgi:hypothetical protein
VSCFTLVLAQVGNGSAEALNCVSVKAFVLIVPFNFVSIELSVVSVAKPLVEYCAKVIAELPTSSRFATEGTLARSKAVV